LTVLQLRRRYDIVHVHNVPDFLVFAAAVPKLMGARIILDIHDILPEFYSGKFGSSPSSVLFQSLLFTERLSAAFAHHVIVANHLWHDRLVARTVDRHKCTPILNYPDLSLFNPLPGEKKRQDDRFVILYPGTLNHHQGLDIALRAFALVNERMPDAEFHIYGEGPMRAELERFTQEHGLSSVVKIRNRVRLSEIAELIASADLGVVPKRADGYGNEAFSTKILEFMACGVPVLVSRTQVDTHYFPETVVRFFSSGNETDLARLMLQVYESRFDDDAWVQRARQFAIVNSWQEHVIDYLKIIDLLLARSPGQEALAG
jgi:glycosyltransferase involved in cell wall biosynthesis